MTRADLSALATACEADRHLTILAKRARHLQRRLAKPGPIVLTHDAAELEALEWAIAHGRQDGHTHRCAACQTAWICTRPGCEALSGDECGTCDHQARESHWNRRERPQWGGNR